MADFWRLMSYQATLGLLQAGSSGMKRGLHQSLVWHDVARHLATDFTLHNPEEGRALCTTRYHKSMFPVV